MGGVSEQGGNLRCQYSKAAGAGGRGKDGADLQGVIQRFTGRGENMDDLFQVGVIGLIKSIDNFKPEYGLRLSTYSCPMIIGEVRRYLRDHGMVRVSRSIRDTAYKALQIREELTKKHRREPSVGEIAEEMGCPKEDVVLALEAIVEPASLQEPVYSDGRDTIYIMDQVKDSCTDSDWLGEISFRQAGRAGEKDSLPALYVRQDPNPGKPGGGHQPGAGFPHRKGGPGADKKAAVKGAPSGKTPGGGFSSKFNGRIGEGLLASGKAPAA